MSQVAIKIENLSKTFYIKESKKETLKSLFTNFFNQGKTKEFKALNNINLEIYKGEFFGIIGHNGSGKSTLLKLIAGIFEPDYGGKIDYLGRLVPFLELGVGFNSELTGKENIFLNGTILGMSLRYLSKKYSEIVEFSEIGEFINMPVKNYSSGMMVRLAFAIAMQSKADIFLLDEVMSVGDAKFQKKSQKVIDQMKSDGKTIVHVSHSMGAIKKYCDRVLVLNQGEMYFLGNPEEAIKAYEELNDSQNSA